MQTKELAEWLNVSTASIRLWSTDKEFGRYLSPSGAANDGATRAFSDLDARILAYIQALKRQGFRRDDICATLDRLQAANWDNLPEMPPTPPSMRAFNMIPELTVEKAITKQTAELSREITLLKEQLADERTRTERLIAEQQDRAERQVTEREETIRELTRRLAEAETELRLYRAGRIKPDDATKE